MHIKYCKAILGVHRKSTNFAVLFELGRNPLYHKIIKALLYHWFRLGTLNPFLSYSTRRTWSQKVFSCTIIRHGLHLHLYLQSFGSVIWFQKYWLIKTKVLTHLKKKLSCIIRQYFINLWYTSKENEQPKTKGKLRTYSTFKNNYGKNTITTLSRLEEKYN